MAYYNPPFELIWRLRETQRNMHVIGVIGSKGVGKTTFIREVFGVEVPEERDDRTLEANLYAIPNFLPNSFVLDTPGTDEGISSALESLENSFFMISLFVFILDGSQKGGRKCDKDILISLIHQKIPFIVCLGQADKVVTSDAVRLKGKTLDQVQKEILKNTFLGAKDNRSKFNIRANAAPSSAVDIDETHVKPDDIWWIAIHPSDHNKAELAKEQYTVVKNIEKVQIDLRRKLNPREENERALALDVKWTKKVTGGREGEG